VHSGSTAFVGVTVSLLDKGCGVVRSAARWPRAAVSRGAHATSSSRHRRLDCEACFALSCLGGCRCKRAAASGQAHPAVRERCRASQAGVEIKKGSELGHEGPRKSVWIGRLG
jgi:hypothetical protein